LGWGSNLERPDPLYEDITHAIGAVWHAEFRANLVLVGPSEKTWRHKNSNYTEIGNTNNASGTLITLRLLEEAKIA
jgi:hypothetical protein